MAKKARTKSCFWGVWKYSLQDVMREDSRDAVMALRTIMMEDVRRSVERKKMRLFHQERPMALSCLCLC